MKATRFSAAPLTVALVLLSLPLLYVGSYMALVDRSGTLEMHDDSICYPRQYRYGGQIAVWFFLPAKMIDEQFSGSEEP